MRCEPSWKSAHESPDERLLATFEFLETCFRQRSFRGCPFISAACEHSEPSDPVFQASLLHKRLVLAYFEELCHAADFLEAKRVAAMVNLLHEGAIAVAQISRSPEAARSAKAIAASLLQSQPRRTQAQPPARSAPPRRSA